MNKGCERCIKCKSIDRQNGTVLCREWTAPKGIAREDLRTLPIKKDCNRWKPRRS